MSAKKKAAAASQDESPEQIVEDVGANESRPQSEGAANVKASDQVSVEDNPSNEGDHPKEDVTHLTGVVVEDATTGGHLLDLCEEKEVA